MTTPPSLTERHLEILALLAEGRSNAYIATTLRIEVFTVKSHLGRMAKVLGTGDRAGMVGAAYRLGILKAPAPAEARPPDARVFSDALCGELLAMARAIVANRPVGEFRGAAFRAVRVADMHAVPTVLSVVASQSKGRS